MMTVSLHLQFTSSDMALRILNSVSPENSGLPQGLTIKSHIDDSTIYFDIATSRGIRSLMATIEDLLSSIDLAIRTMASIE
ncbi:MAG: KEOPS complex subunit Pcc1 [Candidatus Thorarchaeota archaeon]